MNARIKRSFTTSCRVDVEKVRVVDTFVTHVQLERQACSFFAIEFKARASKHYFNCGQPVVGAIRCEQISFFFRMCRTPNLDGGYRAMFSRSTSFDTREANKSKVRILFWNFVRMLLLCAQWKTNRLGSPFFFFSFTPQKFFFRSEIYFLFQYLSHEPPLNTSLSLTSLAYFSAVLNIRGTFH